MPVLCRSATIHRTATTPPICTDLLFTCRKLADGHKVSTKHPIATCQHQIVSSG
jgi:hypothetical protein